MNMYEMEREEKNKIYIKIYEFMKSGNDVDIYGRTW